MLRQAILEGRKVSLGYRDGDGKESKRVVWPVLLGYRDEGRILAAWCELRQDFRHFRTDRVLTIEETGKRFPERVKVLRKRWNEDRQRKTEETA